MHFLEPIAPWSSSMMEPLEARLMLTAFTALPAVDGELEVEDAGGGRTLIGASTPGSYDGTILLRLDPAGHPDASFGGGDGVVRLGRGGMLVSMHPLPDGSTLLLTDEYLTGSGWIYRLRPDGSPDPAYGDHGRLHLPWGWSASSIKLAVQPDGGLLVAAVESDYDAGIDQLVVGRYTPAGRPDPSFGGDGFIVARSPNPLWPFVESIRLAPDAASVTVAVELDPFDSPVQGLFTYTFPTAPGAGDPVPVVRPLEGSILLPDGGVLAGASNYGDIQLRRYRSNGSLDRTFGADGTAEVIRHWSGSNEFRRFLAPAAGGRLYVPFAHSSFGVEVHALTPDGQPDTAFGDDGLALFEHDGDTAILFPDLDPIDDGPDAGGGVIAYHTMDWASYMRDADLDDPEADPYAFSGTRLVVVRFDAAGRPVPTFGVGGRVELPIDPTDLRHTDDFLQALPPGARGDDLTPTAPAHDSHEDDQNAPGPQAGSGGAAPASPVADPVSDTDGATFVTLFNSTPDRQLLGTARADELFV